MLLGISQNFPLFLPIVLDYANSNYICELCVHIKQLSSINYVAM